MPVATRTPQTLPTEALAYADTITSPNSVFLSSDAGQSFKYRHDPYVCTVLEPTDSLSGSFSETAESEPETAQTAKTAPTEYLAAKAPSLAKGSHTPLPALLIVRFKRSTRAMLAQTLPYPNVGTYVWVEGDRGRDIGVVQSIAGTTSATSTLSYRKVLCRATDDDVRSLQDLRVLESQAFELITRRVAECKLSSCMSIQDVEYQYDRTKITVFYKPLKKQVDFRSLQRILFRDFRCRVWLQNI